MESKGCSNLFALVDSHLSQTSLKDNAPKEVGNGPQPISYPKGFHNASLSESFLLSPNQKPLIPSLSNNSSPISSVLAEQVSNMFKAKEKKQREDEKYKLEKEMKKLKVEDDQEYVIDLMKALQAPSNSSPESYAEQAMHKSDSFKCLYKTDFVESESEKQKQFNAQIFLPCITDMSYILNKKIRKGKCSTFGKILTSRLRPVAAPYLREHVVSNIEAFDFSTHSPCDLIKMKLRKPTTYNTENCTFVQSFL